MPSSSCQQPFSDSPTGRGGDKGMIDWAKELDHYREGIRKALASKLSGRGESSVSDVMQEFELAVDRSENKPSDPSRVASWLHQIAHRKAQDYWRKTQRQLRVVSEAPEAEQIDWVSPFDWVLRIERVQEVNEAITCLSGDDRKILRQKYVDGMSYGEIAEKQNLSVKAVEYRLLRAKEKLRKCLTR